VIEAVRHVGVVVSDMERSLQFYRELLGLSVVKDMEEYGQYADTLLGLPRVRVRTVKLAALGGPTLIELLHFRSHPRSAPAAREVCAVGPTHVALTVTDVDDVYLRLTGKHVPFVAPPQRSPDGYAKVTFCRDPDGTLIELVEVERPELGPGAAPRPDR
jgi:catechol 2,3-dioxygenase-like lactoylglutathione lyase family enzyme